MNKKHVFTSLALISLLLSACNGSADKGNYHTVVWLNYDYSVLYKDTKVEEGKKPVYKGEIPQKPKTQQYNYAFYGWSPEVVPAYVDATYVAQFNERLNKYLVTWKDDDGRVLSSELHDYGSVPSFEGNIGEKDQYGYHCSFTGWSPSIGTVFQDITYTATYDKTAISYLINYFLEGGKNSSNNPEYYTVNDDITFEDPTRDGYKFDGWYYLGEKITRIVNFNSYSDIDLYAHWIPLKNKLTLTSQDESKGNVSIYSGSGYSDESMVVVASPKGDNIFDGWYHDSTRVSKEARYSFNMPTSDYSLSARFVSKTEQEIIQKKKGIIPTFDEINNKAFYGLYPQRRVTDSSTISALEQITVKEENGWCLYNDEYYVRMGRANPLRDNICFDDGTLISKTTVYWFKCEPIPWDVLSNNDGTYHLLCSNILGRHLYATNYYKGEKDGIYCTNYEYSEIRKWLNGEFYRTAFTFGDDYLLTTNVDNTASSTDSVNNPYVCNNTQDKVFLPSFKDLTNTDYGFLETRDPDEARACRTTEWARANGTNCSNSTLTMAYLTRSPQSDTDDGIWEVDYQGSISRWYLYNTTGYHGFRPSITLKTVLS